MYPKLIYPKWINGKSQIEFPKSPIMGQIFKFIDQSKEDWVVNIHVYTGDKWVKMFRSPGKIPTVIDGIRKIKA